MSRTIDLWNTAKEAITEVYNNPYRNAEAVIVELRTLGDIIDDFVDELNAPPSQ